MKLTLSEANSLLFIRDNCKGKVKKKICKHCNYYEGYCHFGYFLKTCLDEDKK